MKGTLAVMQLPEWVIRYDDAIGRGVYAAIDIHGAGVEQWIVDYYVAQSLRDEYA